MDTACFLKVFAALFAIMNPVANLPVFLSLAGERSPGEARKVALVGRTFLAGPLLGRMLGQTSISIMSRIMGMILAAIAMEMMVTSLRALWPGLAG